MTTDILIVSCAKHFPWLRYALQSMAKFASGFREIKVMIPKDDLSAMNDILVEFSMHKGVPIRVGLFEDWPDKGFLRHEHIIMCSEEHSSADFILHMDSDTMFIEPVKPEDYFVDGKPVLLHATYHWLVHTQQANLAMWQTAVQQAIGWAPDQETMRRHPAVHYRKTYPITRAIIEKNAGKSAEEYIKGCENGFPQTFCEFNTLGAVAWEVLHDDYHWLDQEKGEWPHSKVCQWWSHQSPELPQSPTVGEKQWTGTPAELLKIL